MGDREFIGKITREGAKEGLLTGAKPGEGFWHTLLDSLVFNTDDIISIFIKIASEAEAVAGIDNTKIMTALRVKSVLTAAIAAIERASREEAIAGEDDGKVMTALRVKEAIDSAVSKFRGEGLPEIANTLKKIYELVKTKRDITNRIFDHSGNWSNDFGLLARNTARTDASIRFATGDVVAKIALNVGGRLYFQDGQPGSTEVTLDQLERKADVLAKIDQRIESRVRQYANMTEVIYIKIGAWEALNITGTEGAWLSGTMATGGSERVVTGLRVEDTQGEIAAIRVELSKVKIRDR